MLILKKGTLPLLAVDSLSLEVARNECFGLLGINGAGKTTLLSMLVGLDKPSSGDAYIEGLSVQTQMRKIQVGGHPLAVYIDVAYLTGSIFQRSIGICPQSDIMLPLLTCEEYLLFYARLKGLCRNEEISCVVRGFSP